MMNSVMISKLISMDSNIQLVALVLLLIVPLAVLSTNKLPALVAKQVTSIMVVSARHAKKFTVTINVPNVLLLLAPSVMLPLTLVPLVNVSPAVTASNLMKRPGLAYPVEISSTNALLALLTSALHVRMTILQVMRVFARLAWKLMELAARNAQRTSARLVSMMHVALVTLRSSAAPVVLSVWLAHTLVRSARIALLPSVSSVMTTLSSVMTVVSA